MWARIYLIPLLQAEEDRDQVRRHLADQAREKELLGENVKVYHTDRYVPLLLLQALLLQHSSPERIAGFLFPSHLQPRRRVQGKGRRWQSCRNPELTWRCALCRFVRPTFAVTPGNTSK
jgi:hypothetical protein